MAGKQSRPSARSQCTPPTATRVDPPPIDCNVLRKKKSRQMETVRKVTVYGVDGDKTSIVIFRIGRLKYSMRTYRRIDGKLKQTTQIFIGVNSALMAFRMTLLKAAKV